MTTNAYNRESNKGITPGVEEKEPLFAITTRRYESNNGLTMGFAAGIEGES